MHSKQASDEQLVFYRTHSATLFYDVSPAMWGDVATATSKCSPVLGTPIRTASVGMGSIGGSFHGTS